MHSCTHGHGMWLQGGGDLCAGGDIRIVFPEEGVCLFAAGEGGGGGGPSS